MIQTQLFTRHYAITAMIVIAFIFGGFFISNALVKSLVRRQAFDSGPQVFFARLVDDIAERGAVNRVRALKHLEELSGDGFPFQLSIVAKDGTNLSDTKKAASPFQWSQIKKPEGAYDAIQLPEELDRESPPGAPHFQDALIRFSGAPTEYLYISNSKTNVRAVQSVPFFLATIGLLIFSALAGIGFALFILFRSIREKMSLADNVIAELKGGNLKARFPIRRMDELGQAMLRFNKMADEIERLVDQLHHVERSRIALLQDLAHDLRTPIASLKNILATIEKKRDPKDQEIRQELLVLSRKEVEYFERLVEDLLTLAQMSEPNHRGDRNSVSLVQIIEEEIESVFANGEADGKTVEVENRLDPESFDILGDSHLLRRLFRNVLENAYSFAKSKVTIVFRSTSLEELTIFIQDDGPGFSPEALKSFGERRASRALEKSLGRVSVGLGSVIIKTVAEIHRGRAVATNRVSSAGEILGAEVWITLPRLKKLNY
jgi:signal transduction histidine kinase